MKFIKVMAILEDQKTEIFLNPDYIATIQPQVGEEADERLVEVILCRGQSPEALLVVKESLEGQIL